MWGELGVWNRRGKGQSSDNGCEGSWLAMHGGLRMGSERKTRILMEVKEEEERSSGTKREGEEGRKGGE